MTKTILVTLVLFHLSRVKTIKVFDTKMNSYIADRPDDGPKTSEKQKSPLRGVTGYFILARRKRFGAAN